MRNFFIISFIVFSVIEIFIIVKLFIKKEKIGSKSTVVSYTLFCIILVLIALCQFPIPYYILLLNILAIFGNSFFGFYLNYFWRSKKVDRVLHCYSSFSSALLLYYIIINLVVSGGSRLFQALFIMLLGIAMGAIYEIFEFLSDSKNNTRMQKGLIDTDFDIIFDIIGSAASAVFAYFFVL